VPAVSYEYKLQTTPIKPKELFQLMPDSASPSSIFRGWRKDPMLCRIGNVMFRGLYGPEDETVVVVDTVTDVGVVVEDMEFS